MMQLAIFINKDIEFFLENCQLCRKSGNDATSRGRWGGEELCYLRHYGAMRTKTDM